MYCNGVLLSLGPISQCVIQRLALTFYHGPNAVFLTANAIKCSCIKTPVFNQVTKMIFCISVCNVRLMCQLQDVHRPQVTKIAAKWCRQRLSDDWNQSDKTKELLFRNAPF